MSLENQVSRVSKGTKDTLKTLINKLGGNVTDELIDQYPAIASALDTVDPAGSAQQALNDAKSYTDQKISEIPTPDVSGQINTHNTDTSAHSDIRDLVSGLTTRLNALADSDDTTLDQLSEIVAYIKNNKSLIDGITTSKVNVDDIINNLTTNVTNKPLSAAQGVVLKALIDAIVVPTKVSELTNDSGYLTNYTETDPTVPAWAKESSKPTYTADEVGAAPSSHAIDTTVHITSDERTAWNAKADAPFKPSGKSYLTFSSPNSFTLKVNDTTKHWDGTLEYFSADKTWTVWDGTTRLSSVNNDGRYVLYIRGTGNTVITGSNYNYRWYLSGSDIACNGNIENLLDYATVESGAHPSMADYCYNRLFQGCASLTYAPTLPAITLTDNCYNGMFLDCTSLTKAPALPATTLASNCYDAMFLGCTGLTQAPNLPATTLAKNCYDSMFRGCTSLTKAPALPATTLANHCYYYMFYGCTSLIKTPALPATILTTYCYYSMFSGCTSLIQAPDLPATTLAPNCYASMFEGCNNLVQIPTLPAITLNFNYYKSMFNGCTSLKLSSTQTGEYTQEYRIPSSGTGTTEANALTDMFASTGGTFTGTPEVNTTYYLSSDNIVVRETEVATLREYVGSISAPASHASDETIHVTAEEKATWNAKADAPFKPAGKSYLTFSSPNSFTLKVSDTTKHWDGALEYFASDKTWTTWDGTTTLSSVDNDGEYAIYIRGTGNTKMGCFDESMEEPAPWVINGVNVRCNGNIETLLDYATVEAGQHPTMAVTCYSFMFRECTALIQAPALPATTLTEGCYYGMFYGCTGLTHAPSLPATTLATNCYYGMFFGCTALTQAPALPATTLATYCYAGMFYGCTGLTHAPALPATTLASNCYYTMFNGCTALTQAPALPATTLATYCYAGMFFGCTSLTQAPALPATTLASNCYQYMFHNCTGLTHAPSLPATTLAESCYQQMFANCTALTKAPALPATTLEGYCYNSMFQGCTSLTQVPALPATTLAIFCYAYMFQGCTNIKLSTTQTGEYTVAYSIPIAGRGTTTTGSLSDMFTSTGGTFTGTPEINITYYLSTDNMVVRETEIATLNGYVGSMIEAAIGNAIGGSY